MKRHFFLFTFLCCTAITSGKKNGTNDERGGRIFSLFNVVTFKQGSCTTASDSTMSGTCMTSTECANAAGTSDGNCAAGFGVCCMFSAKCGTTTTVTRNSQYPSSASAATTCSYTFSRICNNLCQIRLDFTNFVDAPPATSGATTGACATSGDFLTVTSPLSTGSTSAVTNSNPPVVCGTLTGQHMYLDTGTTGTAGTALFTFGSTTTATRTFKVKVTYYTCDNKARPPPGCVQYFTGTSGSFQSYNYLGGTALTNQNYNTCIRQAQGYCSIQYTQDAATTPDSFNLADTITSGIAATNTLVVNPAIGYAGPAACTISYIMIPATTPAANAIYTGRFCGGLLNPTSAATNAGTVIGNISPFTVQTFFSTFTATITSNVIGYNIDYTQVPCSQ